MTAEDLITWNVKQFDGPKLRFTGRGSNANPAYKLAYMKMQLKETSLISS